MARVLFSFFDSWSDELAWWLGLTLGDGNIHRGKKYYRVSMCGTLETTERWLALFAPERKPMEFKNSPGTYQATVDSKQLVELCESQFGMGGPKAWNLPWPVSLPKRHRKAFMRGLWDSDGSVGVEVSGNRRGGPVCRARFAAADGEFVARLHQELRKAVSGIPPVKRQYYEGKKGGWYTISWAGFSGWLLAKWLYDGAPEHLRNEDKYRVYLRMKELRGEEYERRILVERRMKKHHEENAARLAEFWSSTGPLKDGADKVCRECGSLQLKAKNLCESCYKKAWRHEQTTGRAGTGQAG